MTIKTEALARLLFPDEYHEGDCRAEVGREGQPCRLCAEANRQWAERVETVRHAVETVYGRGMKQ